MHHVSVDVSVNLVKFASGKRSFKEKCCFLNFLYLINFILLSNLSINNPFHSAASLLPCKPSNPKRYYVSVVSTVWLVSSFFLNLLRKSLGFFLPVSRFSACIIVMA